MIVTHVGRYDITGGAAIAAFRLHQGLVQSDIDSQMYVEFKSSHISSVMTFSKPESFLKRTHRRFRARWLALKKRRQFRTRPPGLEIFTSDRSIYANCVAKQLPQSDIVNIHWVAGFVDYLTFLPEASAKAPIVWTLHDMNPFTGGCHYASICRRYLGKCGSCPQLGSTHSNDYSAQIWQRKRQAYERIPEGRLHIVTPSRWLAEQVNRSSLLSGFPVTIIPNGLDTSVFAQRDRTIARQALEIPLTAKVVLFGAHSLENQRKGFNLLSDALASLKQRQNLWLLSFGESNSSLAGTSEYVHMGSIENDQLLALIYSAADLFVIPSLEDNLPNTVIEAMACGTPVIGFDVGGIPDMVRPGITGELVPPGDVVALQQVIEAMLDAPERRKEMSINCRRIVEEEYSSEIQAKRYIALYEEMLSANRGYQ